MDRHWRKPGFRAGRAARAVTGLALLAACTWQIAAALAVGQDAPTPPAASQPAASQPASTPGYAESQPVVGSAWPADLASGLIGSKHDFTHGGRSGRDLCLPCHTPHLLTTPRPLLDRRPAAAQPLRAYTDLGIQLSGWSLLCLGCHDGVTAPDVFSSPHAMLVGSEFAGPAFGARGLRSHPVGIVYPTDPAAHDKYQPPAVVESRGLLLPDGRIQCTTCHDAHNTNHHAAMLRISDQRSALCLTCHRI